MSEDDAPVAFTALVPGLPVVTHEGVSIGSVAAVLGDPNEDIFHGLDVSTREGHRFVARDQIELMTRGRVVCRLTEAAVAQLPESPPDAEAGPETIFAPTDPTAASGPAPRFVAVVRCTRGGLFQVVWVPGMSFTALRLGPYRIMRCPVHHRVEVVRRVEEGTLTQDELRQAAQFPPRRVP